ncbi:MAG: hypothetical protein Q7R66_04470 [Undibacterium sp.]|nr:hypothetical protein [Undibacterium sp.]MDO8651422.1 hypothetical protein [Undibacterium sp.]
MKENKRVNTQEKKYGNAQYPCAFQGIIGWKGAWILRIAYKI